MADNNFKGFINYKQTVMDIISDLEKEQKYCDRLELKENSALIKSTIDKLRKEEFNVVILGEFNRGKSTVINAILEKDILPTSWKPCTATINRVVYNIKPAARIEYKDGRCEEVPFENLKKYVTKLSEENEQTALSVKEVTVGYPVSYCQNGVTIYDTPGLNDDANMTEVTLGVLPKVDAAVMVIMATVPFAQTEQTFLQSKLIAGDIGRVIFVVTGIDIIEQNGGEEAVREVIDDIRKKINENILKKNENVYGKDSSEYLECKRKLGDIKIIGLSAKNALTAKLNNDSDMLEKSRFPIFEAELERFLTEDRGAIAISAPLSRINMTGAELIKAIAMRKTALVNKNNSFAENYKDAKAKIEAIRHKREDELKRVNLGANETYNSLSKQIKDYWPSIKTAAENDMDNYNITADMIKTENIEETQKEMMNSVKSVMSVTAQNKSEYMQSIIEKNLLKEADNLGNFEDYFFNEVNGIQSLFVDNINFATDSSKGVKALEFGLNYVTGLGGLVTGFKKAGWKGALVGGAASLTTALTTGFVLGVLGLVSVPFLIIGSALAAFMGGKASKWLVDKVFANKRIEDFRKSFKDAVMEKIDEASEESDIGDVVKEQIRSSFEALKVKVTTETEAVLKDLQAQLDSINIEMGKNEAEVDKTIAELNEAQTELAAISKRADILTEQLYAVMNGDSDEKAAE